MRIVVPIKQVPETNAVKMDEETGTMIREGAEAIVNPLAAGPGGNCICPNCGHRLPHSAGQPCNQQTCPKCGTAMARQ